MQRILMAAMAIITTTAVYMSFMKGEVSREPASTEDTSQDLTFKAKNGDWQVKGHVWQRLTDSRPEPAEETDKHEGNNGKCKHPGMVPVQGEMKGAGKLPSYCIDRFEYPNVKGQYPVVNVSWVESKKLCEAAGKRLCTEDEWTFACEGEQMLTYSYGNQRKPETCHNEQAWRPWGYQDAKDLQKRRSQVCADTIDRLWQGLPTGSKPGCKSPFGAYDMVGNVDEWTVSSRPRHPYKSLLKGGYWGPVKANCRGLTNVHGPEFAFYQIGFRCCSSE